MVMNVLDFEALEAFMAADEWDKANGCIDTLYLMDAIKEIW